MSGYQLVEDLDWDENLSDFQVIDFLNYILIILGCDACLKGLIHLVQELSCCRF